eukprot:182995-Amphidinium_carterae.1
MQSPNASVPLMSSATLKVPPAWDPAWESSYSFRQWMRDILLWATATDVPVQSQAAAVCMRLGGAAKELTKEVDISTLQNGATVDMQDGNPPRHLNGLAVLLRGLSKRFAPENGEQSVKALANVMAFSVASHESVDEVLSRFEVLMSRAADEANFVAQPQAKAWMLMSGLRLPPEEWMHLLHPLNGKLPTTDNEYTQLVQFIRRRGRVHQHGSIALAAQKAKAGGRAATYMTWSPEEQGVSSYLGTGSAEGNSSLSWLGGGSKDDPLWTRDPWTSTNADASMWYEDDDVSSSATEEDMEQQNLSAYLTGVPENMHGDVLWQEYVMARARWRQFTGKYSRANRRFQRHDRKGKGKRKEKGKGRGKGNYHLESAEPYPTADVEAYMKGRGKGKGSKRNPKGPDEKVMKCHNCGSEEHLVRDCPEGQQPTRAFLALAPYPQEHVAGRAVREGEDESFETDVCDDELGRPAFPYDLQEPLDEITVEEQLQILTRSAAPDSLLVGDMSAAERRAWEKQRYLTEVALATSEFLAPGSQSSQLFLPTYERHTSNREPIAAWHAKTTLPDGREGLLVDVGAHDNLCGEQWLRRVEVMLERIGRKVSFEQMKRPLSVEGVGNGAQTCREKTVVPLALADGEHGTYEAPVIPGSGVPGLLGLKALMCNRAVIDCVNLQLYFLGPGDVRMGIPPGSKQYELVLSESGHLLLPIAASTAVPANAKLDPSLSLAHASATEVLSHGRSTVDLHAWIWDEIGVDRQKQLLQLPLKVLSRQVHCLSSHAQVSGCVRDLRATTPCVQWFVLRGPATASGTRKDRARAWHVVRLAREQKAIGGVFVLEASDRSNAWDLEAYEHIQRDPGVRVLRLPWCCLHVRADGVLVKKKTRIVTTLLVDFPVECSCCAKPVDRSPELEMVGTAAVSKWLCARLASHLQETRPELELSVCSTVQMKAPSANSCDQVAIAAMIADEPEADEKASIVDDSEVTTVAECEADYPTGARLRQKAKEKATLENSVAGTKKKRNLKGFEKVWCDCGEDVSAIEFVKTHWKDFCYDDVVCAQSEKNDGDEVLELSCAELCDPTYMLFGGIPHGSVQQRAQSTRWYMDAQAMVQELVSSDKGAAWLVDLCEVCGGEGRVGQVWVRRQSRKGGKTGINLDLACGVDLLDRDDRAWLWEYLRCCKPQRSRSVSEALGRLGGELAEWQLRAGLHFINEHPAGSDLYELPTWKRVLSREHVCSCVIHQCQAGLVSPRDGLPVRKASKFVASDERLLKHLRPLVCVGARKCQEHARIEGGISMSMQVWPWKLASRIADGIAEIMREHWRRE